MHRVSCWMSLLSLAANLVLALSVVAADKDPLPSWNDGPAKRAILDFVACAINPNCKEFIQPEDRITVFDNDGTLWCEQPMYVQVAFALDRVKALAPQHPEWKNEEPFASVLKGDVKGALAAGEKEMVAMLMATHTGMTVDEFEKVVSDWIATARHPKYQRPYTECIYQPMVEVLAHLRANEFKTYIVSGGGIEFMRPWTAKAYGIPPEQVIGSSGRLKYELRRGEPVILKLPEINLVDDGPGKPVGISQFIGRQPVLAFGNSDGDYEMLRYVTAGKGSRLGLIVHHTDAEREYAYDRDSHIGKLDKALSEARERGWTVVSMKDDWKTIFQARPPIPPAPPATKPPETKPVAGLPLAP